MEKKEEREEGKEGGGGSGDASDSHQRATRAIAAPHRLREKQRERGARERKWKRGKELRGY